MVEWWRLQASILRLGKVMGSKSLIRSRWAAIGAAVAVTLGGGGLIGVSAASGDASSLKTTTPTRIMDTRQGSDGKVSGETVALQVTGEVTTYAANGTTPAATVVPAGANAVAVNLTVTQGERNQGYGFVTAFPCTAATDTVPNASTLNFVEGTDVANSTVVPLGASGKMCLNVYGSAHVIVDISGYYETADAAVDSYTKSESDAKFARDDAAFAITTNDFDVYSNAGNCFTDDTTGGATSAMVVTAADGAGSCKLRVRPSMIYSFDGGRRVGSGAICWSKPVGTGTLTITPTLKAMPSLAEGYETVTTNWLQGSAVAGSDNVCGIYTTTWNSDTDAGMGYILEIDISNSGGTYLFGMLNATFSLVDF